MDAYEAIEHGNDDPSFPNVDISFGGRRTFCKEKYSDLGKSLIISTNGLKCIFDFIFVRFEYLSFYFLQIQLVRSLT